MATKILCCVDWEQNYPLAEVTALVREKSDHTLLFLDTGMFKNLIPFLDLRIPSFIGMVWIKLFRTLGLTPLLLV